MCDKLVSVVIPCYNAEKYLVESIDSIINQSYTNLEIICIDDCSTDNTLNLLNIIAEKDSRLVILHNSENLKISKTLNRGIEYAHGAYIARMDADDISLPTRIEKQVDFLERNPHIDICGTSCEIIDINKNVIGKLYYLLNSEEIKAMLLFESGFAHPTVMFRKRIYEVIGGYSDSMPIEDFEYWIRIAKNNAMANLPHILLLYRWHGNNVSITQYKYRCDRLLQMIGQHSNFFINSNTCREYNMRFMLANWNQYSTMNTLETIRFATNEILEKNARLNVFEANALKRVALQYQNRAYLSCAKSSQNSLKVRIFSFLYLLLSPLQTWKNIKNRISANY